MFPGAADRAARFAPLLESPIMNTENPRDLTPPAAPSEPRRALTLRTNVRAGTTIQIRPAKAPRFR